MLAGKLPRALAGLASGLATLARSSGPAWKETVVIVASEFGRAVRPNNHGGTDHGTAGTVLVLGGAVAGGKIVGKWPGLAKDNILKNGGLKPGVDTRSIIKGVLTAHLGLNPGAVGSKILSGSGDLPSLTGLIR